MEAEVFAGIKVLDLSWIVAGPWVVKYLADFGADVIHVESKTHPDGVRTSPPYKDNIPGPDRTAYFVNYHCNSLGVSIDLNHPSGKGIALVKRLVEWADVVVENFAPGVVARWGLAYEDLKLIKPNILMMSLSQLGQTGPRSFMPGTGNQLVSLSGFTHLTGYPDREPCNLYGGFTDTGSARLAAAALMAALDHRYRTGEGQYIDVSQYESGGVHFLAPTIIDYELNGRVAQRNGNRNAWAAPHGVYPCKGVDRWCAITVFSEEQWLGLCRAAGYPAWAADPKFMDLPARKENEDELDRNVAEWTCTLTGEEVVGRLQAEKVPSGAVSDFSELWSDPQLNAWGFFRQVDHPVLGNHKYECQAFKLPKSPPRLRMPAPLMGQHNEYVCTKILGMTDEEFAGLVDERVLE